MKRIFNVLIGVLSITCVLTSCTSKPSGATLLPDDAIMVLCLDVKTTLEVSGIDENDKLNRELKDGVEQLGLSRKLEKKIFEIFENPTETGIDFTSPIFLALLNVDDERFALTGSLCDATKFENLIEAIDRDADIETISRDAEIKYVEIDNRTYLHFNSDRFIITNASYDEDEDDFVDEVAELFVAETSFVDTPAYERLLGEPGLIKMYFALGELLNTRGVRREIRNMPDNLKESMELLDKSDFILAFNAKAGEASFTCQTNLNSEDAEALYERMYSSIGDVRGVFIPYINEDVVFAAAVNFDGKKYLESFGDYLSEALSDVNKKEMNMLMDMIECINGDIICFFDGEFLESEMIPCFSVYGETNDNYMVKTIAEIYDEDVSKTGRGDAWHTSIEDLEYVKVGETYDEILEISEPKYEWVEKEIGRIDFGYQDNISYLTISEDSPTIFKKVSDAIDGDMFVGNKMYAYFNFASLLRVKEMKNILNENEAGQVIREIMEEADYAELVNEDNYRVKLRVIMKDKEISPIATYLNLFTDFL